MKHRVVVTGLGVVSPVGLAPADFYANLASGRSGIRSLPGDETVVAGIVAFNAEDHFSKLELIVLDRFSQFALSRSAIARP